MIGPTSAANRGFGSHPVGMNRAVMSPQAMNAPMFGMIIPARYPPRRWTVALTPVPSTIGEYGIDSMFNSPSVELVVDA